MNPMQRVLSGIQPTADSYHLGNYLGALKQWIDLQDGYEAFYFIPDLHAITVDQNPEELRYRTLAGCAQLIALGIDPERSTLFVQSHVPEHAELTWVLQCLTGFGEASRMTQFKDKSAKNGTDSSSVGLFTYPILMAADILLYDAQYVPVGEDQRQHLELTRNLAQRFNSRFGETFVVPEPYIPEGTAKVMSLQDPTKKMSKSDENANASINMLDETKKNTKKIKSAVTDLDNLVAFDAENKPGIANLLRIHAAISGESIETLVERFAGENRYGALKTEVAEVVASVQGPFRERYLEFMADRGELDRILADGAARAREIAAPTLARAYDAVGLVPATR